jgi:hypothetical protein
LKEIIEQTLKVLLGLPLWNAGRSANLGWFDFGSRLIELPIRNGGTTLVGEYVIDTECAWHIIGPEGIIVASRDRLYPAGEDPYKDLLEFEWDKQGANRCDERMNMLLEDRRDSPMVVESIEADRWGGIKLTFSEGYNLEIFPDDSLDGEYWRFFEPSTSNKHFVVTRHGIET